MTVFSDITDRQQPDNVVDFVAHREVDNIKGQLATLCASLRITEGTLTMAAQFVRNAKHAGADDTQAYAAGIRYAKAHQEAAPDLERSFRDYEIALQMKRISDASRRPLSLSGELSAMDAAFGDGPEVA